MSKIIFLALYIFLVICIEQSDDKLFANAEKEYDIVIKDSNLIIEEYISGLDLPVMIDFIGDDMLVIEKAEGTVKIIRNDILISEPLIQLKVSSTAEEGLVGILVDGDYVYLHYTTKNSNDGTTSNLFTKYLFDGEDLIEQKEMLAFHGSKSAQHNSGVMFTDKDGVVYGAIGDTCFCDGLYQNNPNGENDNTGSIISLELPREIYAIGIRNTYGLDFDPVTGILWNTENGPESFDEVNLVEKKFNSGWNKVQGPIELDQKYPEIEDFIYSDPEFSWERTVGVTGIHFIESSKFPNYSNSVLVGSFHGGVLYNFELNEKRDGFKFSNEDLKDLVLNKDDNPNEIILATGFLGITDIKQGPDGLIYIVSIGDGKIYRLSSLSTELKENKTQNNSKCNDFTGKDFSHCNFSGKDFSGKDFSGKDFSFVDFSNSSFNGVNFYNSNIVSADFTNSEVIDVNFSKSNLNSAIFKNTEIKDSNFEQSSLVSSVFINSRLTGNNFINSDFERGVLSDSEIYDVNFENVRFFDSDFDDIKAEFLNFKSTDMSFVEIKNSTINNSEFDNSRLWKSFFIESNLQNSSFTHSDNYYSVFKDSNLENSDFQFSRFSNVEFSNTNLKGASLLDVYPIDPVFNNIEFDDTKINTCLNHDMISRILNKILRSIDGLGLQVFENMIVSMCN